MNWRVPAFSDLPISRKLILAGALPTITVLALAGALFFLYESTSLKKAMPRDLATMANFLALASRASLSFEDPQSATDLLNSLQTNPRIVAAAIYDQKREHFASYSRTNSSIAIPPVPPGQELKINDETVEILTDISLGNKTIGSIYLVSDLLAFKERIRIYGAGVVVAIVIFSAISLTIAFAMQRSISTPLNELAGTARVISENNDFNVRASQQKGPELNLLTTAFNQMLSQIQRQDASLRARTAQLETTNKELEAFTYTVSHDLRAPLRAMSSYSHLLRKNFAAHLPEEARDYLQRVQNNAQKMAELIDELLTFSRLDAEPLQKTPINLTDIFRSIGEELMSVNENHAVLKVDTLPTVEADPILIQQVATNLLSNAFKYSRNQPAPEVQVGCFLQDGNEVIFVRDNGVGFDMLYSNKLFGVFQRLHSGKEFEGTGVGLAIVQRIVKRHGGAVWAEAQVGKGATFYFYLAKGL
ncbi:MAG: ATP-binding protein [Verrucomicrobiales bacterium]